MKIIGLVGGFTWQGALQYYRELNQATRDRLDVTHSAECILRSIDCARLNNLQKEQRYDEAAAVLVDAAKSVERAGADVVLLCNNTLHVHAKAVAAALDIPLLHIADAIAQESLANGLNKLGIMGTRFTMEHSFYRQRLAEQHNIEAIIPTVAECDMIDDIMFTEVFSKDISPDALRTLDDCINKMVDRGAEAIVFSDSYLASVMQSTQPRVIYFDAPQIHALRAVDWALPE